jgi:hypothetical protein
MAKNYGSFAKDKNQVVIDIGTKFTTSDATSSPQNSPLAITTAVTTIAVPTDAAEMVIMGTVALRVSEIVGMTTYDFIPANQREVIPVARMDNVYIKADSTTGSLNFRFNHVAT